MELNTYNLSLFLVGLILVSLPFKGYALWLAARRQDTWWFVAIFFLYTLAVLDIIYIFVISHRKNIQGTDSKAS